MVYGTKYHAEGSTPPRYREYHSGQGVQDIEGQVRLDVESSVIQEDSDIGHSDNRLVSAVLAPGFHHWVSGLHSSGEFINMKYIVYITTMFYSS